jgi:uncharacterized protein (TIGR03435 family)
MIGTLANHLWQSTAFALAAALFTGALRNNRAQVRFAMWFCASVKFLIPFSLLMSFGSHFHLGPTAKRTAPTAVTAAIVKISQPFAPLELQPDLPSPPRERDWLPIAILGVWSCGFVLLAAIRLRNWRSIRAALRTSTPLDIPAGVEVRAASGLLEPGAVGWFRPVLLLPAGIENHLTAAQLNAVLAHEQCHICRRDNLTSAIHMLVEAVFWFHPLVWWIGARLVEERERACDEEVLRKTGDPTAYADAILMVCKQYVESPLACMSGVIGSDLKKRIEFIMTNRTVSPLHFATKIAIVAAAVAAVILPFLTGVVGPRSISAQSTQTPRFVTASIRPAANCDGDAPSVSAGAPAGPRYPQRKSKGTPGILHVHCATLGGETGLIRQAYVIFATGHARLPIPSPTLSGGPAWLETERFDIEATADGEPGGEMMRGPMMQALLEDKLSLKIRRETKNAPAYALVATSGTSRLQEFQEGSCTPQDWSRPQSLHPTPGVKYCSFFVGTTPTEGSMPRAEAKGATLSDIAKLLSLALDRPVIDATGVAGRFNFYLEFAPDETTPQLLSLRSRVGTAVNALRPILTAIQEQYGLKLVPSQAPREFLVVEHVEKPSFN